MTNQQHPITPPPELVEQWANASARTPRENVIFAKHEFALATQAAQWGADQELEACVEWLAYEGHEHEHLALRSARRPKPSLKEKALAVIENAAICDHLSFEDEAIIRQALEALPND